MDTSISGQPPYNGQNCLPLAINCPYISTSDEGKPSNNGQNARPHRVYYSEAPLYTVNQRHGVYFEQAEMLEFVAKTMVFGAASLLVTSMHVR